MFDLVFKEALIRDGFQTYAADLAVTGEKIAAIGHGLAGNHELSAAGKWLMPGFIDVHTHMSLPFAGAVSADDFFTGTRAGTFGGVTTIIDFTSQKPGEGLQEGFQRRLAEAEGRAAVDFAFHACIGKVNERVLADLPWALEAGLSSLKVFMAYSRSGLMQDDPDLLTLLEQCREAGLLLTVHAESGRVIDGLTDRAAAEGRKGIETLPFTRPVFTEVEAIGRLSHLARAARAPVYVVHVSSGEGAAAIRLGRQQGAQILGETCPQYLTLSSSVFQLPKGHLYACCPPVRPAAQQIGLWEGLREGHLQVVATDHCPFKVVDKDRWGGEIGRLPMGLPGIETLGPLTFWGAGPKDVPVDTVIRSLTANPARLFGIYPRKGSLQPGADADLVLFDPEMGHKLEAAQLHMGSDYSPYEGLRGTGWPVVTVSRGEILVENGQWHGKAGRGRFLVRGAAQIKPFLPHPPSPAPRS